MVLTEGSLKSSFPAIEVVGSAVIKPPLPARLMPCVCGFLPPREGGLHDRWADCTDSCHGEAACLVIGCAVDPTIPCGLLSLSARIAETLAIGNE